MNAASVWPVRTLGSPPSGAGAQIWNWMPLPRLPAPNGSGLRNFGAVTGQMQDRIRLPGLRDFFHHVGLLLFCLARGMCPPPGWAL